MNVILTGAAGFIGFHTCMALLKKKIKVYGIDNLNTYYDVSLKKDRLSILKKKKKSFVLLAVSFLSLVSATFLNKSSNFLKHYPFLLFLKSLSVYFARFFSFRTKFSVRLISASF